MPKQGFGVLTLPKRIIKRLDAKRGRLTRSEALDAALEDWEPRGTD